MAASPRRAMGVRDQGFRDQGSTGAPHRQDVRDWRNGAGQQHLENRRFARGRIEDGSRMFNPATDDVDGVGRLAEIVF